MFKSRRIVPYESLCMATFKASNSPSCSASSDSSKFCNRLSINFVHKSLQSCLIIRDPTNLAPKGCSGPDFPSLSTPILYKSSFISCPNFSIWKGASTRTVNQHKSRYCLCQCTRDENSSVNFGNSSTLVGKKFSNFFGVTIFPRL